MHSDFPYQGPVPEFKAPPELKPRLLKNVQRQRKLSLTLWWSAAASLLLLLGFNLSLLKRSGQTDGSYSATSITTPLDPYAE